MSLISIRPFDPTGATANVTVTGVSANVAVPNPTVGTRSLRIANIGTVTIFVTVGKDNTVAATLAAGMPIAPNTVEYLTIHNEDTFVAAIAGGAGSVMYITAGNGK